MANRDLAKMCGGQLSGPTEAGMRAMCRGPRGGRQGSAENALWG